MARPTILTPELHAAIVRDVAAGNYAATVAAANGISESVFYRWTARGRAAPPPDADNYDPTSPEEVYREFVESIERARARAEIDVVGHVSRAIRGGYATTERVTGYDDEGRPLTEKTVAGPDGRLGLDYLSRVHKQRWSRPATIRAEVSGPDGGPVQVEAPQLTRLEQAIQEGLARLGAAGAGREIEPPPAADPRVIEGELA